VGSSSSIVSISSQLDAVINVLSTVGHDSSLVELPRRSIDADRDGSSGRCLGVDSILSVELSVAVDSCLVSVQVGVAWSGDAVSRGVGVFAVGIDSSGSLDVLVSVDGPSSVASVGRGIALDDLLHGEGVESLPSEGKVRLDSLGGRECPAASALSLVVDTGDDSVVSPVEVGGINFRDANG